MPGKGLVARLPPRGDPGIRISRTEGRRSGDAGDHLVGDVHVAAVVGLPGDAGGGQENADGPGDVGGVNFLAARGALDRQAGQHQAEENECDDRHEAFTSAGGVKSRSMVTINCMDVSAPHRGTDANGTTMFIPKMVAYWVLPLAAMPMP